MWALLDAPLLSWNNNFFKDVSPAPSPKPKLHLALLKCKL
jgi:hypothetical protein